MSFHEKAVKKIDFGYHPVHRGAMANAAGVQAADNKDLAEYTGEEYVVTATRTSLTKEEVPQSVEIITREDIESVGAVTVRDVLKTATNLNILDGAAGHGDKLSLRGSDSNDILILINGRRVAGENIYGNGSGNNRALDRLNLSNVERVEIVRGPAGALWGSDAQGGVINIITKKSEKQSATIGVATGSREMSNYYHIDTGKQGKVSATFDVNFSKLRNFDGKAGTGFAYGPKQSYTLDVDYEMDEDNKLNLYLDYNKQKFDYAFDMTSYNLGSYLNHRDQERKTAALTYEGKNKNSKYSLSATYSQIDLDSNGHNLVFDPMPPKVVPEVDSRTYKTWMIEARDSITTAKDNTLTFGGEIRVNEGNAYIDNGNDRTDQYALYLQDEFRSGKLLLVPSVRYDHYDTFGSHTSPNIGATYFVGSNSRFKVNYGSAYRAPSVDELYGTFNHMGMFTMYGNADLKPGKSRGYELSYEHEFGKTTSAKVAYFRNKKEDAITTQEVGVNNTNNIFGFMGVYDRRYVNIDHTTTEGVEFEIKHDLGNGFTLSGSYDWLDARDDSTGDRLDYTARNVYTAKLQWTEPVKKEWGVTAWNRWYTDYTTDGTDSWSGNTFNIAVNKRWGEKFRAFVALDNVFDKEISDLSFYGRLWRVGAEMTF